MWVSAEYEATALFTLKPATATASGGRTLPVPTPFAIKMALLDVVCRVEGVATAAREWNWLNGCMVALRPAERLVVNNTFIKVLKPRRNKAEPGSADAGYFQRTITYREYACFDGAFGIALQTDDGVRAAQLQRWLTHINYLGKRGSFIQLQDIPEIRDTLAADFIEINGTIAHFGLDYLLLQLDDTGESLTFEKANIYSGQSLSKYKDRVWKHVALPCRLVQSSRGYSYYERVRADDDGF